MEKAPSYSCSTLQILTRSRDFYSLTASLEYLAQSWSVLSGISALGGRSTFMSDRRKQRRRTDVTTEKENFENNRFDQRFWIASEDCEVRRSPEARRKPR